MSPERSPHASHEELLALSHEISDLEKVVNFQKAQIKSLQQQAERTEKAVINTLKMLARQPVTP